MFYDQNTNLSANKGDMYKTANQLFYTPPKSQSAHRKSIEVQKDNGFHSPIPLMTGHRKYESVYNEVPAGFQATPPLEGKIAGGKLFKPSSSRKSSCNKKNHSNIPCLSKTNNYAQSPQKVLKPHKSAKKAKTKKAQNSAK